MCFQKIFSDNGYGFVRSSILPLKIDQLAESAMGRSAKEKVLY
jgi:hypothetical protein